MSQNTPLVHLAGRGTVPVRNRAHQVDRSDRKFSVIFAEAT